MFVFSIFIAFVTAGPVLLAPIQTEGDAYINLLRLGYAQNQCDPASGAHCMVDPGEMIRLYQKTFGLNQTGVLDDATKELLSKARCGNPDIMKKSIALKSNAHSGNPRWRKSHLKWTARSFPPQISPERTIQIINESFQVWSEQVALNFEYVCEQCSADLVFDFSYGHHGDTTPFDERGGQLAHAYFPEDGRIHFDAAEDWNERWDNNGYNLFLVLVHEIGHALGLYHNTDDPRSIMFPMYQVLNKDDLIGTKDQELVTNMYGERQDVQEITHQLKQRRSMNESDSPILRSDNHQYKLFMQTDGNLCLKRAARSLWCSEASSHALRLRPHRVQLEPNGNLVIYSRRGAIWTSGSRGKGRGAPYLLELQDDGILVIYDKDRQAVWKSRSDAPKTPILSYLMENGAVLESKIPVLRSSNHAYKLLLRVDGNLCVYPTIGYSVWCTGTDQHSARLSPHRLVMQSDGNLVLYSESGLLWSSNTLDPGKGSPYRLELQDDGILVIYDRERTPVWNSRGHVTTPRSYLTNEGPLLESQTPIMRSNNGNYVLYMHLDGNLCLYQVPTHYVWCTRTHDHAFRDRPHRMEMKSDGNLVVYSQKGVLWTSGLQHRENGAPYRLELQDNGILVIYDKDRRVLWTSLQGRV